MNIVILESADWGKSLVSKKDIANLVKDYATEAENLLDNLSRDLNIIVKPNLPHISSTKGVG